MTEDELKAQPRLQNVEKASASRTTRTGASGHSRLALRARTRRGAPSAIVGGGARDRRPSARRSDGGARRPRRMARRVGAEQATWSLDPGESPARARRWRTRSWSRRG